MADDFGSVKTAVVAMVLNTHPNTTALIAAAMVRQLAALQAEAAPFMEKSGDFSTVADRAAYDANNTVGFPKSLLRFDRLFYDLGSVPLFIDVVDAGTVRYFQEQPSQAYPRRVCWQEGQLQFGPAPAGMYTVKWDGVLDATKDEATGETITESSTTHTNPWLVEGVVAFKHLVLADYFMTSPDQRPDLAQSHASLAGNQLDRLRKAQAKRKAMNTTPCIPNAFDEYVNRPDLRIQTLFPGARG